MHAIPYCAILWEQRGASTRNGNIRSQSGDAIFTLLRRRTQAAALLWRHNFQLALSHWTQIPFNSHTLVDWRNIMYPIRNQQLIRQRAVAKSSLTRMQTFIETDLITFLESRCKTVELLQTTQSMKASTTTPCSSRPAGGKVSNLVYCNVATQLLWLLCSGSHRLFHCDKFLNWKPSNATICQEITTMFQ